MTELGAAGRGDGKDVVPPRPTEPYARVLAALPSAELVGALIIEPRVIRALLRDFDALREALRDANRTIEMMRAHLEADHPECPYIVLGLLNDAGRRALAR